MRNLSNSPSKNLPLPQQSAEPVSAKVEGIDKFTEYLRSVERNLQRERGHSDGTMMGLTYDS
jgi:hypothetical protein